MTKSSQLILREADISSGVVTGAIRLLATTDLHGHLLAYDYFADRPQPGTGLAGLATLIETARNEAAAHGRATVLLDNGDILQGTPLASRIAKQPVTATNPIVACLNALKYDAVGVGNHDLDHGKDYLAAVARALDMPMVCSNLAGVAKGSIEPWALVRCTLKTGTAQTADVQIGVVSLIPTLTKVWNRHVLGPSARIEGTVACLRRVIPELRQRGADLIVVLAHMGVGQRDDPGGQHEGALTLVDVPGIDAVITGHTHRRLPGLDYQGRAGVDADAGKLGRMPAVMAGHGGSDLAVLDLQVIRKQGVWQVSDHHCSLRANEPHTPQSKNILSIAAKAHAATRRDLALPIAHAGKALHNYFALVSPSDIGRLTAEAKARIVHRALKGTPQADLPLLASAAAHTSGGRAGPDHYLHIPKGQILRRHIAGLDPYANHVVARLINGRGLLQWLEHSARIFASVDPTLPEQDLIDPSVPSFHFDTIYGVHYEIDPTIPALATEGRIKNLTWRGNPIDPDQPMIIATSQFRAAGGGGFNAAGQKNILRKKPPLLSQALAQELSGDHPPLWSAAPPWRFVSRPGVRAAFLTAPSAEAFLSDIAHLSPQHCGLTHSGFARIRISL